MKCRRLMTILLGTSIFLSACGRLGSSSIQHHEHGDVAPSAAVVKRHIDEVWKTEGVDLDRAHELLERECMRSEGAVVPSLPPSKPAAARLEPASILDRYTDSSIDLRVASQLRVPGLRQYLRNPPKNVLKEVPIKNYDKLAYGAIPQYIEFSYSESGGKISFPISGCDGEATHDLYGVPARDYYQIYWNLPRVSALVDQVLNNSGIVTGMKRYQECMTSQGFIVATPADIYDPLESITNEFITGRASLAQVQLKERAVENSDATCKRSTGTAIAFTRTFAGTGRQELIASEALISRYRALVAHASDLVKNRPDLSGAITSGPS